MQTFTGMASASLIAAAMFSVFLVLVSGFEKGLIYTIELHLLYFPIPFLTSLVLLIMRWSLTGVVKIDTLLRNLICGFALGMIVLGVYHVTIGSTGLQSFWFTPFSGLFGGLVGGIYWFVLERESRHEQSSKGGE